MAWALLPRMKSDSGLWRSLGRCTRGVALASALSTAACGDDASPPTTSGDAVMLVDANNYTANSILTLPSIPVAAGQDVTLCWDQLTQDMQCHGVVPTTDVDLVSLLRFDNKTKPEVAHMLGVGRIRMQDFSLLVDYQTTDGSTCAQLSQLTNFGSPWDMATEFTMNPSSVYVAVFARGTTPGVGALTMVFLDPSSAESNLQVSATDGCAILDFQANLAGVTPVQMPAAGPFLVDWSMVTRDSTLEPLPRASVDQVLLGFYPGLTAQQLQEQILDLELIAAPLYRAPLTPPQQTVDLTTAVDATGTPFSGFTRTDGVWALAVMCSSCQNPAPSILTIIAPS